MLQIKLNIQLQREIARSNSKILVSSWCSLRHQMQRSSSKFAKKSSKSHKQCDRMSKPTNTDNPKTARSTNPCKLSRGISKDCIQPIADVYTFDARASSFYEPWKKKLLVSAAYLQIHDARAGRGRYSQPTCPLQKSIPRHSPESRSEQPHSIFPRIRSPQGFMKVQGQQGPKKKKERGTHRRSNMFSNIHGGSSIRAGIGQEIRYDCMRFQ